MQYQQYQQSPKDMTSQMPLPHTTAASTDPSANVNTNTNFFSTSEDMFQTGLFNAGNSMAGDSLSNGFLMGTDWDMSALATGMPPMSEGGWNQMGMLDSLDMGWDPASVGPPHVNSRQGLH
jgi:hypothetical protein